MMEMGSATLPFRTELIRTLSSMQLTTIYWRLVRLTAIYLSSSNSALGNHELYVSEIAYEQWVCSTYF